MQFDCIYRFFRPKTAGLALLLCTALSVTACIPVTGSTPSPASEPASTAKPAAVREYTFFNMGGIRIKMTGPENYVIAPSSSMARQSASLMITPPENIFAVFFSADDILEKNSQADAKLLRNRRAVVVSARPEFMNEYVEPQFFQALRKDLERVNGTWQSEDSLKHFQRLTGTYYKNRTAFTHNLGVFHSTRYSLSMARIVREGGSEGSGAASVYSASQKAAAQASASEDNTMEQWSKGYFSKAYHKVLVQNVLLLNGRYFNVYFSAPLASYADIYALLNENRQYMNLVAMAARSGELDPDAGKAPGEAGPSASSNAPASSRQAPKAVPGTPQKQS